MSKDAEIERAFKQAEKDAERRERRVFTAPIPIWEDPEQCPKCRGLNVVKMLVIRDDKPDRGMCYDCKIVWELNERENDV